MNNKKVFSFHMFLQTLKQTRLAGFIMMAVITLISVVPIISSLSYIKEYKQVNNVGGISGNYFLVLVFLIREAAVIFIIQFHIQDCAYILARRQQYLHGLPEYLLCHMYHRQFY